MREPYQLVLRACRRKPYKLRMWQPDRKGWWEVRHPQIVEAYYVFRAALKLGWLKRQPCEVCGDPNSDGHHEDYTRPLKVMWLCRLHHRRRHSELRRSASRKAA